MSCVATAQPPKGITDAAAPCRDPPHHRRARGPRQGGPGCDPSRRARRLGTGIRPARPRRAARGAGGEPRGGAGSDPLRAHAGLALHLLPRRCVSDGRRPRRGAAHGTGGPAVRRRASVELRRLRGTRPEPGLQRQRLRRDAAGPVRVGRQAPRGQLRGRRPRPRLQGRPAQGDQHDRHGVLPGGHAPVRRDDQLRALVQPHQHRAADGAVRRGRHAEGAEAAGAQGGQDTVQGQRQGVREAHPHRRRRAADRG